MPNPDKPNYSHGSTGNEPSSSLDYENGDPLDANNLDYYVNTLFVKVKSIIDTLNTIDSDGDGKVDAADTADNATTASQVKGNDIDTDGDGKVNAADNADVADTANLYKYNDIDSDGDGKVDAADNADYADEANNADTVDGKNASDLGFGTTSNDLSDLTTFKCSNYISGGSTCTLVDVAGSGQLVGGDVGCETFNETTDVEVLNVIITVDGGTPHTFSPAGVFVGDSDFEAIGPLPNINFDNSLKIELKNTTADNHSVAGVAHVKQ